MEPKSMPLEPEVQSGEDFVHTDDPITNVSLSDSITNVEEELLVLGEEEEEEHSTAGSVITGGDPIDNSGDDDNIGDRAEEKLELPEEFRKSVMVLKGESSYVGGCCDVYLVGTIHVSQESCREVEAVISSLKPEVVFVELCSSRYGSLCYPQTTVEETVDLNMKDMWKNSHNIFDFLHRLSSAKTSKNLDVVAGAEFRVAYEEAKKYGGKVIPGDREFEITFKRAWRKLSLWQKITLGYAMVLNTVFPPDHEEIEELMDDDVDMITLIFQAMTELYPSLADTFVHERDMFMTHNLWDIASQHSSVVAVVGKMHLQGIKKNWRQPPTATMKELTELPTIESTSTVQKILYLGVVVAGMAIVSRIYLSK